ncbi:hypothetical protein APY30_10845 [Xanthomonas citri pv. malvacearum]|nr:hypothetical protein APY29_11085 [Xanthomonas citri pv. malvacearum]ASN09520.1 hypothetical protein APY30_10845 [Xanthomonas citri pv. malvacearum]OOW91996.1 hypothetical protein Xmlv_14040 [Xanthomonas citri pv. malvacearum]
MDSEHVRRLMNDHLKKFPIFEIALRDTSCNCRKHPSRRRDIAGFLVLVKAREASDDTRSGWCSRRCDSGYQLVPLIIGRTYPSSVGSIGQLNDARSKRKYFEKIPRFIR